MDGSGLSWSLILAAFGVGVVHTVLGPDHYLPFIMLAKARGWTRLRTILVTSACGVGHVASSVLLGGLGIVFGVAVAKLEIVESGRGNLAAWAIVAFGIAYALWGLRHALRSRAGLEAHVHGEEVHIHSHGLSPHGHEHRRAARISHRLSSRGRRGAVPSGVSDPRGAETYSTVRRAPRGEETPPGGVHRRPQQDAGEIYGLSADTTFWTLFVIFVLGPCEPLIPLFALPASQGRWDVALLTAAVFGIATLVSMVGITLAGLEGLKLVNLGPLERWAHVAAGSIIAAAGLSVIYLGL